MLMIGVKWSTLQRNLLMPRCRFRSTSWRMPWKSPVRGRPSALPGKTQCWILVRFRKWMHQNHPKSFKHPFFKSLNHWTTICLFVYWKQNQGAAVTGTHWEATENDVWWTWGCGWRCQDGADFASCPKNLCVVMSIYVSYVVLQWPCKTMWTSTMLWSSPMRLPNIIVTEPRRISAVSGPCSINAGHPFGFPCAK